MSTSDSAVGDRYVLATGDAGAQRLLLLQNVYGPWTSRLLTDAGLREGMRVAEIGCGVGTVTCEIGERVGPTGSVVAVDASADQTRLAALAAERRGLDNVQFHVALAGATGLADGQFDLVYCRLLLCHLERPDAALSEFRRLLKSGGTLVCEDLAVDDAYAEPRAEVLERMAEYVRRLQRIRRVDYSLGKRLPRLVVEAGFAAPQVRTIQPAYYKGDEKRWWELTFVEAAPASVAEGVFTADELSGIQAELQRLASDTRVLIAQPSMTQVWAQRP